MEVHFATALVFVVTGILFILATLIFGRFLRPRHPSPEKLSSYECGMDAEGTSWIQFNIRFYIIALIFLIFDVEIVLLFPWVTIFADPDYGWLPFVEMLVFISILVVGFIYVWVKKDLEWVKSGDERRGG